MGSFKDDKNAAKANAIDIGESNNGDAILGDILDFNECT